MAAAATGTKGKRARLATLRPALANWLALHAAIMGLGEGDCEALLEMERGNANRPSFVRRIHCRLAKLRREREKREMGI